MTLYIKRLRKSLVIAGSFRYMYVVEPHKSGLPHIHCIIIQHAGEPLTRKALHAAWGNGFTLWRRLDNPGDGKAAAYCAKYAGKEKTRIRASIRFGKEPLNVIEQNA